MHLNTSANADRDTGTSLFSVTLAGILLLFGTVSLYAAPSSYIFSKSSETYQELQNDTVIAIGYGPYFSTIDLGGEIFRFFGRSYTIRDTGGIQITGLGNLRIDDATTAVIIDALFATLDTLDATSRISYLVEGSPGDHIVKIQWKNAGFEKGGKGDRANVQIWLYQQSGMMEIRYGQSVINDPTALDGGPWVGAFIAPPSFTKAIEKCWITGDPAHPGYDTTRNLTFPNMTSIPPDGTVYRLTPRAAAGVEEPRSGRSFPLFPNPASERVRVATDEPLLPSAVATIIDARGKVVALRTIDSSGWIDISSLAGGAYTMEISDGTEEYSARFVKRK